MHCDEFILRRLTLTCVWFRDVASPAEGMSAVVCGASQSLSGEFSTFAEELRVAQHRAQQHQQRQEQLKESGLISH